MYFMSPRFALGMILLALLNTACGTRSSTESAPATAPPTPAPATSVGAYAVHEWGLVDIEVETGERELAAGPGAKPATTPAPFGDPTPTPTPTTPTGPAPVNPPQVDPAPVRPSPPVRPGPQMGRRKPVLYFHLLDGAETATFDVAVQLSPGILLEHFPAATTTNDSVRWDNIALAQEPCRGPSYPNATDPSCTAVQDGYCEMAELRAYESPDAGCLTFSGMEHNLLFYRGGGRGPELPIAVQRTQDSRILVSNRHMEVPTGAQILRLRRNPDRSVRVSMATLPARGEHLTLPVPTEAASDQHRSAIRNELARLGLTAGEQEAFARAWFLELLGLPASDLSAETEANEQQTPEAFTDAVLYFMAPETVESVARLEFEPAPREIKRAMAVRMGWR